MEQELRTWRIHVDVRCAIDLPFREKRGEASLPSTFVEVGWTVYNERPPDMERKQSTKTIDEDCNPVYNESFVVEPPASVHERDGYLYVGLQYEEKYEQEDLGIYIPLSIMNTFVPYHFQVYTSSPFQDDKAKGIVIFSVYLEEKFSDNFLDSSVELFIYDLIMEPLPFKINNAMILMTLENQVPNSIPFIKYDATQAENLSQKVLEYTMKNEKVWASPTISVPYLRQEGKNYCCKFPLLKSMLNRSITFFVMTRDESIPTAHPLPNVVVGSTETTDLHLKTLLYSTSDEPGQVPVHWNTQTKLFRAFEDVKCLIDLNVKLTEVIDLTKEETFLNKTAEKTLSEGIDLYAKLVEQNVEVLKIIEEDGSQWRILQEQLVRNQDDIKRLFRDLDSKTQSLKLSAAEVINVKRKIRNIKKDNLALREEVEKAGQFEPEIFLNRPELMAMDDEEVRNKIISIAKAYRDERVRNKNLMKTLKMAQKDIADRTKVLANLKKIEESTNEITGQMAVMAHEFGKVGSYRETINKQEAMILRLEGILKTMAKQSKEVRVGADNFSKEIEENEKLRNNIQVYKVPDNHGQYAQYKEVVKKLEKEITQLQAELVSNRPVSAYKAKQVGDRAAKEVLLDRANARSFALEQQISGNTTNYAQQIAVLKSKIAEKDAMLKAISKEF